MLRSKVVIALTLTLAAAGIYRGYAQQRDSAGTLTALDYIQIQQLYATFNRTLDFDNPEAYAALWTPDTVFVLVSPAPATGACQANGPWHVADRSVIRGTVADKKGGNICVSMLTGSQHMAGLVKNLQASNPMGNRHRYENIQITPTPEGAAVFAYLMQLDVSSQPPRFLSSAFMEDTVVKTSTGWRFKKRIREADNAVTTPKR